MGEDTKRLGPNLVSPRQDSKDVVTEGQDDDHHPELDATPPDIVIPNHVLARIERAREKCRFNYVEPR